MIEKKIYARDRKRFVPIRYPKGMPNEVVSKLVQAAKRALREPTP